MIKKIESRLQELKTEFESTVKKLSEYKIQYENLKNRQLLLSGAIQVLEELLTENSTEDDKKTGEECDLSQSTDP